MGYELIDIARIGALFLVGDQLEEVMPLRSRQYTDTDDIDYVDDYFNELKRVLLLTERIDPSKDVLTALWVLRTDREDACEVMIAGKRLPREGFMIHDIWPELKRAFSGLPTRRVNNELETVYFPVRNSLDRIVGVLEVSEAKMSFFI